ncbi:MAG: uncharacterized protein JWN25_3507 [Verrucomicrobiales bacterium]|jgi:hypothetical protein|nr:uncharacterized protein [Verrucomicrobiales bacterium]MDB6129007.1 uncharacterized protein [Verrucomicrobiales bacterium]
MTINKWTLGLAAAGVVSLASVAQAEEQIKLTPVMTALSSTTLSGYVDTSAIYRPGTGKDGGTVGQLYSVQSTTRDKQDGFNLNVVSLTLDKPLDEGTWSAGYHVQTLIGPDANGRGTGLIQPTGAQNSIALNEAYVALRAPVGNGLDFKIGQFGTFVGYESFDSYKNPNYSRSYGFWIEPSAHVGVTASYTFNDMISAMVGVGNAYNPPIDAKAKYESVKTYLAMVTLTAPESTGFLKGSTLSLGYDNGAPDGSNAHIENFYAGATLATPVAGFSIGAAFDAQSAPGYDARAYALYLTFQATEKLKANLRAEYASGTIGAFDAATFRADKLLGITGTLDYALWQNVVTRAEVRWDHSLDGEKPFSATTSLQKNEVTVALNVIYKF